MAASRGERRGICTAAVPGLSVVDMAWRKSSSLRLLRIGSALIVGMTSKNEMRENQIDLRIMLEKVERNRSLLS